MKRMGIALLAAGMGCLFASTTPAAVLVSDDLRMENPDRAVTGGIFTDSAYGRGWTSTQPYSPYPSESEFGGSDMVRYDVGSAVVPGGRGMLELLLVNDAGPGAGRADTVFEFASSRKREGLWVVQVDWNDPAGTKLIFEGERHDTGFPGRIVLPAVARGQALHLALSWDDSRGTRRLSANGRVIPLAIPKKKVGRVAAMLKDADLLRLGVYGRWEEYWPDGPQPADDTVILGFALHDDPDGQPVLSSSAPLPATADITSLEHDAARIAGFSGKLVAGDTLTVGLGGTPGREGTFDVARLANLYGEIALDWKGWGVYLEDITFFDEDQVDLREVEEYRVYAGTTPFVEITGETPFVESLEVEEQRYVVEGLEPDIPYYLAVMAVMDDGTFRPVIEARQGIPMTEVEGIPGTYEGTLTVGYTDRFPDAVIVGRLASGDAEAVLVGEETFEADPSLAIAVVTTPEELKADEKSTAEVQVTVTDANGEPVQDHEVRFLLATTSQYTGVMGGGTFTEEVGGGLSRDFRGVTDLFGQVEVEYTAGFAAKTAIIVARDMESGDTGAGYVKTYITAVAELELEAVQEVAGKSLGYSIVVTSSDEWLTADGESEARITALVTKDGIPVEGHRIGFTVSGGSGTIRTVQGVTDEDGKARALYTAGRKIGMVLIRAIDHAVGISGSVQIELRSDAPAKIGVVVTPDVLPADGRSTADVEVVVTDINDNPSEGVEVEYAVAIGSGRLRSVEEVTDSRGESTARYVAGRIPGKVSIEVTVRSTVPTDEELAAARELAKAVTDYDFY